MSDMPCIAIKSHKIPVLGYGTWQLHGEDCVRGVRDALNIGYRHIDTAQIYENEKEVGQAIEESGIKRDDIFLTTKVWIDNVGNGTLQKSVDESLLKLQTDYVDLLLIHWPVDTIPFTEQMRALCDVRDRGLARLIGVSNFTVAHLQTVRDKLGVAIACNQVEYHPYLDQQKILDFARTHDMFVTAYSPVARGQVMTDKTILDIAARYDKNPAQIALRWLVQQDRVAAIPKAATIEHMRANFDIFDFTLSDADMKIIHNLARPDGRLINPAFAPQWDKAQAA